MPVRAPAAQLVELADGRLLVRHRSGLSLLSAVSRAEVEALLDRVDGERTAAAVVEAAPDPRRARGLLEALAGEVVEVVRAGGPGPAAAPGGEGAGPRVEVVAPGPWGSTLVERLHATGTPGAVRIDPEAGAGDPEWPPPLAGTALVVAALERVPYRRLLALEGSCLDAGVPVLFVTSDPDGVRVGPAVLPGGATPCLGCSLVTALAPAGLEREAALAAGAELVAGPIGPLSASARAAVAARVAHEVAALLRERGGAAPEPRCLGELVLVRPEGPLGPLRVGAHEDCPRCSAEAPGPAPGVGARPLVRAAERRRALRVESEAPRPPAGRGGGGLRVGILGGGTAGGLAALAFRARRPGDRVTLVRSRDVPVIGVGEATTPLMPQFLHADLGLDPEELFREVRPTFKLGIRFDWGAPGGAGFPYPFGPVRTLEAATWDGDLDGVSLQAARMAAGALPVEEAGGGLRADFGTEVAYHLDNRRFAAYLERQAAVRGVDLVEARIVDVERRSGADGEAEVAALVAEDGRRLDFDLYVDCSGFRSLLLGEALGSRFVSYEGSLFTDRAVIGSAPHGAALPPYTRAHTLAAGWCWSIPQEEADHVGYVYSSRFLDAGGAAAELRALRPGLAEEGLREVGFRAGRREHFWRGNVVALGNAYGFVEPLESTALHLLLRQIGLLVRSLPDDGGDRLPGCAGTLRPLLDRRVGAFWDYVGWFLALHFRFNGRLDTPFWRVCRAEADVSAHGELLALYRERGPLAYDPAARSLFDYPDPLWGPEGVDTVLLGQGVPCRLPPPPLAEPAWRRQRELCRRVAGRGLSQEEVLRRLPDHPEVLAALAASFRARGPAF